MVLEIHNFTQNEIDEKAFQRVAEAVLKTVGVKDKTEISLAVVGDGRMRKLNKMYRGKNRATDVLAFGNKSVLPYLAKSFPRLKKKQEVDVSLVRILGKLTCVVKLIQSTIAQQCLWRKESSLISRLNL